MMKIASLNNKKGQSLIEFAVILPILILLVFGIIDFGRLILHQSTLSQSAREAVRMTSIGNDITTVNNRVGNLITSLVGNTTNSSLDTLDDEGNNCTKTEFVSDTGKIINLYITPVYSNSLNNGDDIRVSITYTMEFITPLTSIFGNTKQLKAVYFSIIEKPPE